MDDSHIPLLGVEVTNSYQDNVTSTSDCHTHFSGLNPIILDITNIIPTFFIFSE